MLITGRPGVGKTTLIGRLVSKPIPGRVVGFLTQEIREGGKRTGFAIRSLDGRRGVLASVRSGSGPRVGKYRVNLRHLEEIGVSSIEVGLEEPGLVIIDEIGKMELLSQRFRDAVQRAFDSSRRVVATIRMEERGFTGDLMKRKDTEVLVLTEDNRDTVFEYLVEFTTKR